MSHLDPIDRLEIAWMEAIDQSQYPIQEYAKQILSIQGTPAERSKAGEQPRRQSGGLAESIYVIPRFAVGTLSVNSDRPYWRFLDAGTGTMEARPIREPITRFGRDLLIQNFRNHIRGK